ncbi:general secretion pathway protein GspK [Pelagibius sp. Alg239-R121]|uniref:general secretion pathway protein GspK n=1 Tax=Pelagibius sp. Alg239-R121 TaxID=2993448 RepID=UPI0024A7616B|nr:type II secretion system protein GspK [Pelagibius sp. Alg239-R121]
MNRITHRIRKSGRARNSRGVALVAVIWVTAVLAVIATSVATSSRTETSLSRNRVANAQARALADAGVHRAILSMLSSYGRDRSPATTPPTVPQDGRLGPQAMRGDGTVYSWPFGGGVVSISVRLESGKINLNGNNEELFQGLLASAGLPPSDVSRLSDSIIDFRDPDSERRAYGRETPGYAALGLKYGAKNRNFDVLDELLLVPGVTRELYRKIKPAVTVYSAALGFNPSYAPAEAFMALPGMNRQQVQDIITRRQSMSAETFRQTLPNSTFYSNNSAPVMTIIAQANTADGASFTREAVVALTPNEKPAFHIFTWN